MTEKYFVDELGAPASYIELRILTYIECEKKIEKITEILNFLNNKNFVTNLSMLYHTNMRAENMVEQQNVASLTIDLRDEKFRFKYWDGSQTYWTYHTIDLFDILVEGRKDHENLVAKYEDLTRYIFDFRAKNNDTINRVTYKYYPVEKVDIMYEIQFDTHMKDEQAQVDMILKELFEGISERATEDMAIDVDYTFREKCIPCQKAREQQNENN